MTPGGGGARIMAQLSAGDPRSYLINHLVVWLQIYKVLSFTVLYKPLDHPTGERRSSGYLHCGTWSKVQTATVEIDRADEVPLVAEFPRRVFHPLNSGVDRLADCAGDSMP